MLIDSHRLLYRFAQDDSGVAAIEFGIVSVPLIMLVLMTLECGIIFHISSFATEAANDAARIGKTGNLYGSTGTREALIKTRVQERMAAWLNTPEDVTVDHKSFGDFINLGSTGVTSAGSSGELVLYTISINWSVFSPPLQAIIGDTLPITATALVKNEEF